METRIELKPAQATLLRNAEAQMATAKSELNIVLAGILASTDIVKATILKAELADKPYLLVNTEEQTE